MDGDGRGAKLREPARHQRVPSGRQPPRGSAASGAAHPLDAALALQRQAGNGAVASLLRRHAGGPVAIQRFTGPQLHRMCLAEHAIAGLSDDELAEALRTVAQLLPTFTRGGPDHLTALGNQRALRRETARRQRRGAFEAHVRDIEGAGDRTTHQQEARELAEFARSQLDTYADVVRRYLQQSAPDAATKVRVLGQASAAAARMEFLLGSVYHQGRNAWEVNAAGTTTSNRGTMVDDYTGGAAMEWCTRFATSALRRVRGSSSLLASSGYKAANPGEFAAIDLDYDAAQGGAFAGTRSSRSATAASNPFAALRGRLQDINAGRVTDQTAEEAVRDFFDTEIHPQAGDLLILRRGSASANSFSSKFQSHTTMIESVSGTRISTVEGNTAQPGAGGRSDRVAGRTLDLTDPGDVEEIVYVARPSLTSGLSATEAATVGTVATEPGDEVTELDLLDPLQHMNELLEDFARRQSWVNTAAPAGASVGELAAPDGPTPAP